MTDVSMYLVAGGSPLTVELTVVGPTGKVLLVDLWIVIWFALGTTGQVRTIFTEPVVEPAILVGAANTNEEGVVTWNMTGRIMSNSSWSR